MNTKLDNMLRKQLEVINLLIGATLIIIGFVYLFDDQVEYFFSWFIFGCMYIVMDKYWPNDTYTKTRIKIDTFKYIINVCALVAGVGFVFYLIFN